MRIGYIRVSTVEQNLDRQREALEKYDIEKWYEEKVSGKDTRREKLQEMLEFAREGDVIYIHDFSRLARSTKDLLDIVERLKAKGIELVSVKENIDTSTASGKLMLTMVGAINEFERTNLLERQREGIEIAKRKGRYKGRKPVDVDEDMLVQLWDEYTSRMISKPKMAERLGISRMTLDKILKERGWMS